MNGKSSRQALTRLKKKNGGDLPRRSDVGSEIFDQNRRSTACEAWLARDRAVWASCWRVLRASRFAPSSFESASVRLSAPDCKVPIIDFVNSCRICTVARLDPKDDDWV